MCCSSKKKIEKPIDRNPPTPQNIVDAQAGYVPAQVISTTAPIQSMNNFQRSPKSRINFMGNQVEYQPFSQNQNFIITEKLVNGQPDFTDRAHNYATQISQLNEPQLLMSKQILRYQLDVKGGITQTPVLNTFDYMTSLQHCFLAPSSQLNPLQQRSMITPYSNLRNSGQLGGQPMIGAQRQSAIAQNQSGILQKQSGIIQKKSSSSSSSSNKLPRQVNNETRLLNEQTTRNQGGFLQKISSLVNAS